MNWYKTSQTEEGQMNDSNEDEYSSEDQRSNEPAEVFDKDIKRLNLREVTVEDFNKLNRKLYFACKGYIPMLREKALELLTQNYAKNISFITPHTKLRIDDILFSGGISNNEALFESFFTVDPKTGAREEKIEAAEFFDFRKDGHYYVYPNSDFVGYDANCFYNVSTKNGKFIAQHSLDLNFRTFWDESVIGEISFLAPSGSFLNNGTPKYDAHLVSYGLRGDFSSKTKTGVVSL